MPGILNKLFTRRHSGEAKLPQKIWAFLKKINGLLVFRFYNCGLFEGGPGANISYAFLFNTTLLGSSVFFFYT